jgi:hypothetical protein
MLKNPTKVTEQGNTSKSAAKTEPKHQRRCHPQHLNCNHHHLNPSKAKNTSITKSHQPPPRSTTNKQQNLQQNQLQTSDPKEHQLKGRKSEKNVVGGVEDAKEPN